MWSKYETLALAKDMGEVVILWRNSRKVNFVRCSRSRVESVLLGAKLQAELNRAFEVTS